MKYDPNPSILATEYEKKLGAAKYMEEEERQLVIAALRLYARNEALQGHLSAQLRLAGGALEGNV